MLSVIFGTAFEVHQPDPETNVRIYTDHTGDHTYVGHDSAEIIHVCDDTCLELALPEEYLADAHVDGRYVSVHPFTKDGLTHVRTADVHDFDPGDDPYILCEACKAELLRDDERFEAEFGHPIGDHP